VTGGTQDAEPGAASVLSEELPEALLGGPTLLRGNRRQTRQLLASLSDGVLSQLRPLSLKASHGLAELPEFRARGRTD